MLAALLLTVPAAHVHPYTLAFRATEILVVDEGGVVDGVVTIAESWRGRIPVGTRLEVPDLARYAAAAERTVLPPLGVQGQPRVIDGKRLVLFMMNGPIADETLAQGMPPMADASIQSVEAFHILSHPIEVAYLGAEETFEPCDGVGAWRASAIWMDGSELFGMRQDVQPGPTRLQALLLDRARLRALCKQLDGVNAATSAALTLADPVRRAAALDAALGDLTKHWRAAPDLVRMLTGCGEAALPHLEVWASHPRIGKLAAGSLPLFGEGGAAALTRTLKGELAFWSAHSAEPDEDARALQERAELAGELALSLASLGERPGARPLLEGLIAGLAEQASVDAGNVIRRLEIALERL